MHGIMAIFVMMAFALTGVLHAQEAAYVKKAGDIRLYSDLAAHMAPVPGGATFGQFVESVTESPFSHNDIVKSDSEAYTADGVNMEEFGIGVWYQPEEFAQMRMLGGGFVALRFDCRLLPYVPNNLPDCIADRVSEYMTKQVTNYIETKLNLPYDFGFAEGWSEVYCSELIREAWLDVWGITLVPKVPMASLNWDTFEYLRVLFGLPLDRMATPPVSLIKSPYLKRVYVSDMYKDFVDDYLNPDTSTDEDDPCGSPDDC